MILNFKYNDNNKTNKAIKKMEKFISICVTKKVSGYGTVYSTQYIVHSGNIGFGIVYGSYFLKEDAIAAYPEALY